MERERERERETLLWEEHGWIWGLKWKGQEDWGGIRTERRRKVGEWERGR